MSHDVITIVDDDSVLCARCTFRNNLTSSICAVCSAPLQVDQGQQHHQQHRLVMTRECKACTYANGGGAVVCSICHMPLEDDVERATGGQMFVEDHVLGTDILSTAGEQILEGRICML